MTGYTNRTIRRDYPELGEGVYVVLRNPQTAPPAMMSTSTVGVEIPADREGEDWGSYAVTARLIRDWRVFDATSDEDEQPLLELPATAEKVSRLPFAILNDIATAINEAVTPR